MKNKELFPSIRFRPFPEELPPVDGEYGILTYNGVLTFDRWDCVRKQWRSYRLVAVVAWTSSWRVDIPTSLQTCRKSLVAAPEGEDWGWFQGFHPESMEELEWRACEDNTESGEYT